MQAVCLGAVKEGEVVEAKREARACDHEEFEEDHSQAMHPDAVLEEHGSTADVHTCNVLVEHPAWEASQDNTAAFKPLVIV